MKSQIASKFNGFGRSGDAGGTGHSSTLVGAAPKGGHTQRIASRVTSFKTSAHWAGCTVFLTA